MDYTNWDEERAALKAEIYRELREQRDRERSQTYTGLIQIEPQILKLNTSTEYGPFPFPSTFSGTPNMSFCAYRTEVTKPLTAVLEVSRWDTSNGNVTGFYLSVYPITEPPRDVLNHTISWIAQGTASVYHEGSASDAWTTQYDNKYNNTLNIFD